MMWMLCLARASEPPPVARPTTESVSYASAVLSNDLRVVIEHHPTWRTVSIATVIDGGLVAEPRAGLTHALADGWLASSPTGRGAVGELYDRLGAESRVRVEPESTVFWVHGPADATGTLLALEMQRFADPLARLQGAVAPTRPAARDGFTARYLELVYASLYPQPHPYHGIWQAPADRRVPLEATAEFAAASWVPARTTLVVAGPMEPSRVLCSLDPMRCGTAPEMSTTSSTLALPDGAGLSEGAVRDLPVPAHPDVGPVSAGVPGSAILLAWSMPGLDSGTQQIGRFAKLWVERSLRDEPELAGGLQCHLFEGRRNSSVICVVRADAGLDLTRLRKRLGRGWARKGLDDATLDWRRRTLGGLIGASGDASELPAIAEHVHHSGEVSVHGGALEGLAFDERDVARFLDEVFTERRLVVVRLVP
ncbi:MAG: hypothetical protein R3F61_10105 [Myxococcota bacterium]